MHLVASHDMFRCKVYPAAAVVAVSVSPDALDEQGKLRLGPRIATDSLESPSQLRHHRSHLATLNDWLLDTDRAESDLGAPSSGPEPGFCWPVYSFQHVRVLRELAAYSNMALQLLHAKLPEPLQADKDAALPSLASAVGSLAKGALQQRGERIWLGWRCVAWSCTSLRLPSLCRALVKIGCDSYEL